MCVCVWSHHSKGHELQDATPAALLRTLHTLLDEILHKLCVRACGFRAQDGGDQQEQIRCKAKKNL